jgi:hypothetical protein
MDSACRPDNQHTSCCLPATTPASPLQRVACPFCSAPGKVIPIMTVRAQLRMSLRLVAHEAYHFCATPDCPVVYFSPDRTHQFTVDQLREPVFQKAPTDPTALVCYCFQYTRGAMQEIGASTHAQIVADITAGVQAGQCACDIRNPQGSCCLGNVRRLITALPRETQPSAAV